MKKYILTLTIGLIIIFGFLIGKYVYKMSTIDNDSNIEIGKSKVIEDECTAEYEYLQEIEETNAKEQKVSPNASLITNIYYNECGHTVKRTDTIENKYINLNEEELAQVYNDWEITKFTPEEITLYKEEAGICGEHYIIKEKDGYVTVYNLDDKGKETLKETTEISIEFLPLTDSEKIKGGIQVYGKENLYSLLEDFE